MYMLKKIYIYSCSCLCFDNLSWFSESQIGRSLHNGWMGEEIPLQTMLLASAVHTLVEMRQVSKDSSPHSYKNTLCYICRIQARPLFDSMALIHGLRPANLFWSSHVDSVSIFTHGRHLSKNLLIKSLPCSAIRSMAHNPSRHFLDHKTSKTPDSIKM